MSSSRSLALIHQFFSYLDIPADQITVTQELETISVDVALSPEDAGIYIGRFASTLDSLQLLLALILRNNGNDQFHHVFLDIGGYRARRQPILEAMAARVAREVENSGSPRAFPPLSATERRQLHLFFQDHATLTTFSQGEGRERRLFLAPKTS